MGICTSIVICSSKTPLQDKSINSSLQCLKEVLNIKEFLYVFQTRLLTMSVFSMAHLKVDASVEFSGDQSVGHDHHQPWDCKQHEQQQDVPEGDATPTVCINRKKHFNSIKIRHVNVQLIIRNSKTAYQSYQQPLHISCGKIHYRARLYWKL